VRAPLRVASAISLSVRALQIQTYTAGLSPLHPLQAGTATKSQLS